MYVYIYIYIYIYIYVLFVSPQQPRGAASPPSPLRWNAPAPVHSFIHSFMHSVGASKSQDSVPPPGAPCKTPPSRLCHHSCSPCPCPTLPRRAAAPPPGAPDRTPTSRPWYHSPPPGQAGAAVSANAPPQGPHPPELHAGDGQLHRRRRLRTPA